MICRPASDADLIARLGDPRDHLTPQGTVPGWERKAIVSIDLPAPLPYVEPGLTVRRLRCHRRAAAAIADVLADVHAAPAAWATIGDFGGCYVFRRQRRSSRLSRHAFGIALDLDCAENPFGAAPRVDPLLLSIFDAHGFAWGGRFGRGRTDGMHFELADLSRLTS